MLRLCELGIQSILWDLQPGPSKGVKVEVLMTSNVVSAQAGGELGVKK